MPGLARWVLDIFYRRAEVVGVEHVPLNGPLVVVGNHHAALIDPALFFAYLPRAPRLLAKSTLWKMASLRPFLKLAAAIAVFRAQDAEENPGVDRKAENAGMFRLCHEVLASGGVIGLFPEGISHNEPALVPLRTGVSRIVLEAMARFPDVVVPIVPVGLIFDDKTRFRSRVLVNIGPAVDTRDAKLAYADDPRGAVRQLTDRLQRALEQVTLNYPSWQEARLIERAESIWTRPFSRGPHEEPMAESVPRRQLFIEGYADLVERYPDEVRETAKAVEAYDRQLEVYGLTDAQVASRYPPSLVWRFLGKSLWLLLVLLPLGILGSVLNAIPFQLADRASRQLSKSPDTDATYKIFPALILYPLCWLLQGALIAWLAGPWSGVAVGLLGPISGRVAIYFRQRRDYFARHARAFLLLRSRRPDIEQLRHLRRDVAQRIEALVERHRHSATPERG